MLRHDPLSGHLFCFRGRRGDLLKVIWHDGQGACLFTKRLERGRFIWPSVADGVVTISPAQLSYLLSGIDWRNPQETWRPTRWVTVFPLRLRDKCDSFALVNRHRLAAFGSCRRPRDDSRRARCARGRGGVAEAANAQARLSSTEALIAYLKLRDREAARDALWTTPERTERLIDQLELQLEELEAAATEDELAAEAGGGKNADRARLPAQAAGAQALSG